MKSYKLYEKFYKIVSKHVKEVSYEGLTIDKEEIAELNEEFTINLMRGFLTFIFEKDIKQDRKGYFYNEKYHSREDIVLQFLSNLK